jgi:putative transposase
VRDLAHAVGVSTACAALSLPRSSFYRAQQPPLPRLAIVTARPTPPRALSPTEKVQIREVLNSERFQDQAPREVYATLLDEGLYLCSWRTMYHLLDEFDEVRERRNQLRHPPYVKPELVATAPNQLWSWDITKLLGPEKWTYYYLYVILDVYSRYIPGWLIAERESAELAEALIATTCAKQGIVRQQLTVHADNGATMLAQTLAQLFSDLGITPSHSRPHVSDDNPYSEAHFKTMKYRPDYPSRFGSAPHARQWAHTFFTWYNRAHHHTALGLLTPEVVHYGQAPAVLAQRQRVLAAAFAAHPERFVKGPPTPLAVPKEVWINRPQPVLELPGVAH